jgi:hypothetical protein
VTRIKPEEAVAEITAARDRILAELHTQGGR